MGSKEVPTIGFRFDGVEYVAHFMLTPAESIQLREWTGISGGAKYMSALSDGDPAAWAAAIIFAQRRNGVKAEWGLLADCDDFMLKLDTDGGDDADPPPPAGDVAADQGSK